MYYSSSTRTTAFPLTYKNHAGLRLTYWGEHKHTFVFKKRRNILKNFKKTKTYLTEQYLKT